MEAIYGVNLALALLIALFGANILVLFRKVDTDTLKERIFLSPEIAREMWLYASFAGVFAVAHTLVGVFRDTNLALLYEVLRTLFLISFLLLTYSWYKLLRL